jgi:hypothetical protein
MVLQFDITYEGFNYFLTEKVKKEATVQECLSIKTKADATMLLPDYRKTADEDDQFINSGEGVSKDEHEDEDKDDFEDEGKDGNGDEEENWVVSHFQRSDSFKDKEIYLFDTFNFALNQIMVSVCNQLNEGRYDAVAIPLFYSYRAAAILPQFLKNCDHELFQTFYSNPSLEVILAPTVIQKKEVYPYYEDNEEDNEYCERSEYGIACVTFPLEIYNKETAPHLRIIRRKEDLGEKIVYAFTGKENLLTLEFRELGEYIGNEEVGTEGRYFNGAMLIRLKK